MSSNFNNAKIINVYYNKGDRKPYDVNGKPIAYIGEEFVGSNEGSELRFFFGEDLDSATPMIITKRPDGQTHLDLCEKVGTGANSYYKVVLNDWYAEVKGKLTLIFKVYNGTVTLDEGNTEILSASGQVIVSDIFNLEVGYAPLATSAVPPYDPDPEASWYFALSTKLDKAQSITVTGALPSLAGNVYDDRYFYVEDEGTGRLYYINGSTAIEVVFQVGTLRLTPTGNGEVTADTGKLSWNQPNGTVNVGLYNDVTLGLGEDVFYYGKASGAIVKGDIVQFAGTQGDHFLIKKAVPNEINANPKLIMGVAKQDMDNNEFGYVAHFGKIEGVDTKGYAVGSFVWFASGSINNGEWTTTQPTAPNAKILVAVIVKEETSAGANNGVLLVRPTIEPSLKELQDVHVVSIANNQILRWNNSTLRWENTSALTTAETNITDLQGRMTTEEANVDNLQGRMTTAESNIINIEDGTTAVGRAIADENGDDITSTYLKQVNATNTYIPLSQKGANNGVVPLNSSGKISSIYLSGEQDDYIEFANLASFPLVGEADIIYCAIDTGLIYRWTGSTYAVISPSLALGTTSTTAFPGDRGLATETTVGVIAPQVAGIISGTQTLTNTRITNSANNVVPLIVNTPNAFPTQTSLLQEWKTANTTRSFIDAGGELGITGVYNPSASTNSYVQLLSTGTLINRNINDTNVSLIVRKQLGTGNILELRTGVNDKKFEVDVNGWFYQNGTRLFHQTASDVSVYLGKNAGNLTTTALANTSIGASTANALTSGGFNVFVGHNSGAINTTGASNVFVGQSSGGSMTTGTGNTFIGQDAGATGAWGTQLATGTNMTAIGRQSYTDKSNQMVFGNASVSEILLSRKVDGIKVGIGTTTPSLLSFGNEFTISGSGFVGQQVALLNIQGTTTTDANIGALSFFNSTTRISSISGARSGADNSGRLVFNTSTTGTLTEKMTILPNGNVGIGTSSPTDTLQVNGAINIGSNRIYNGASADSAGLFISSNQLNLSGFSGIIFRSSNAGTQSQTERMRITDSGNVGIGTSSPATRLHIFSGVGNLVGTSGSLLLSTDDSGTDVTNTRGVGITFSQRWQNATGPIRVGGIFGVKTEGTGNYGGGLSFYSQSQADVDMSERMRITSTGLVGINETSPSAQLQVKSGATNRVGLSITTEATSGHTANLLSLNSNSAERFRVEVDGVVRTRTTYANYNVFNNSNLDLSNNGAVISRNIADTNPALIVNLANSSATGNIQVWQKAGTAQAWMNGSGELVATAILNKASFQNSLITLGNSGTLIYRSSNDSNVVLKVQQNSTATTGNLQEWILGASSVVASVNKDGIANFTGTPSNAQTVDYTLVLADKGKVVRINSSSNLTVTIPLNSTTAFPIDTEIAVLRYGTGTVSISPTSGVTLNSKNSERKISGQYGSVALKKIGTDEWVLVGSLEA